MVGNQKLSFKKVLPLGIALQSLDRIVITMPINAIWLLAKRVMRRSVKQIFRKKVQHMRNIRC